MTDEEFYARHDEHKTGVFVVQSYGAEDKIAIFSTFNKAKNYMDSMEESCVCSPFVIDEPEFGNVPKNMQN